MTPFVTFQRNGLTLVEISLTANEIQQCLQMGDRRTRIDEEVLGWRYRHHGKPSSRAHGIGFIGELAFEKWLQGNRLERDIDYKVAAPFVTSKEQIAQDFTIWGKSVGVKTANSSLERALSYGSFLYPAKVAPGESKRVLDYPDFLVQAIADTDQAKCWLCGFVERDTIIKSPIRMIHEKPAHSIAFSKWQPLEKLLEAIRTVATF